MKFLQYLKKDGNPRTAIWNNQSQCFYALEDILSSGPSQISDVWAIPAEVKTLLRQFDSSAEMPALNLEDVTILPSILAPSKILCVGLNYADHAEEFGDSVPEEPVIFCKPISALNAHLSPIIAPKVSRRVDYEAELVVVIGQSGKDIPQEKAMDYVAGYTCGNDVTCRDWQKKKSAAGQWFLGKSFDTFAPIGPVFVTADEIPDPNGLAIESRLNGRRMQFSDTSHFIFPIEKLIAYISQVMTLCPGDLIFTGTPGGIGDRRNPPVYLTPGDKIVVEIEKIGILENPVK